MTLMTLGLLLLKQMKQTDLPAICGSSDYMMELFNAVPLVVFSVITEIGRCAKAYCEHTARSVPTLSDTVVTLIEMGKRS